MEEFWKPIPNYEGLYEISNTGKIKRLARIAIYENGSQHQYNECIMTPSINKDGYYQIHLTKNKEQKTFTVHKLVALTFIPNPNNFLCINHKDENKLNNHIDNLEWCTREYNSSYGSKAKRAAENNPRKKQIVMCDLITQKEIKTFDSVREAARQTGISHSGISKVINGKGLSAGGYYWKIFN